MRNIPYLPPDVGLVRDETRRRIAAGLTVLTLSLASAITFCSADAQASSARAIAEARGQGPVPVQRISFRDLDLTLPAHVAILRKRVKVAAIDVCQPGPATPAYNDFRRPECIVDAIASGRRQINQAIERARGGQRGMPLANGFADIEIARVDVIQALPRSEDGEIPSRSTSSAT